MTSGETRAECLLCDARSDHAFRFVHLAFRFAGSFTSG
jgi:hypothetical protein